jgi:UDP-3-O-[3-hydroxymyristoyl] N-acetylglucosamine deacetylase
MIQTRQRTLKQSASCEGVGLHSGVGVRLTLFPAAPYAGIVFRRSDVGRSASDIPARWDRVQCGALRTMLGNEHGVTVGTVEHLMAAFAGCAVDNAIVEIDGPEVPIMDGSAAHFVRLIEGVGTRPQDAPRRRLRVLKKVRVVDNNRSLTLAPADEFSVRFEIDFENPTVSRQTARYRVTETTFKEEISGARTFGFAEEVDVLRARGFGLGGTLDNAVVVDGGTVLNEGGLRYPDEFVRHKVLDCIGDMYLVGGPMLAEVSGIRSGHALSHRLLFALFRDKSAWRFEYAAATERVGFEPGPVLIAATG